MPVRARQAGDVKPFAAGNFPAVADLLLRQLADDVKLALKCLVVLQRRIAPDENLHHVRLGGHGGFAKRRIVRRDVAPAKQRLAFAGNDFGERGLDRFALRRIFRHEQHADAVLPLRGQLETELLRRRRQKFVRRLHEDARAVAGVGFASARAAVVEVHEDLQRVRHQLVRLAPLHVDDEAHAAGIVLKLRVVKPLLWRWHCPRPAWILVLLCVTGHCFGD